MFKGARHSHGVPAPEKVNCSVRGLHSANLLGERKMHTVHVTESFRASPVGPLDDVTNTLIEELIGHKDPCLFDADVSAELATGLVDISIVSRGDDYDHAVTRARSVIARAIAVAGVQNKLRGSSPVQWEKLSSRSEVSTQA